MFTIAISGQFDRMTASFVNRITHHKTQDYRVIGVGRTPYEGIHRLVWRTGSLVSHKDTIGMLEAVDALVLFCMTPPDQSKTSEGHGLDVALAAAVNLAKSAQLHDIRVILVMRKLPESVNEQMPIYDFWLEVKKIFQERCSNLCVIQCDPILNETDAITLAIFERLCTVKQNLDGLSDNRIRPASMAQLFETIQCAIHSSETSYEVFGTDSISWREWLDAASKAISIGHQIRFSHRLPAMLMLEGQQRERLLKESIKIQDTVEEDAAHTHILRKIIQFTQDMIDDGIPTSLRLAPEHTRDLRHTCYVQRLVAHSRRSVSDTTDLLMQWLPRYFKRAIRVDELGGGRMFCRLGVIPILELEKVVETESRCRVHVRFPWGRNSRNPMALVLMTTGLGNDLRKLLLIAEDAPDSNAVITGLRAMMVAFGMYLKEYG